MAMCTTRYVTELNPEVMKCMAGFSLDEEYFVPCSEVAFPDWMNHEEAITRLFPSIIRWRQEHAHGFGDHSEAANNFLNEVLPFLATVIVQDGIYWIHQFPNHEASRLLKNVLPPSYERWAATARQQAESRHAMLNETHVQSLNLAAQQAFHHITNELKDLSAMQQELMATQRELSEQLSAHVNAANVLPVMPSRQAITTAADVTVQQDDRLQQRSVNDVLRSSPRIPSFPVTLPNSMAELLQQHEDIYKLGDYTHAKKSCWPSNLRQAFGKRIYLYQQIVEKADRLRNDGTFIEKKRVAAAELDRMRNNMTLPQFMIVLKNSDPNVKKRKRAQDAP